MSVPPVATDLENQPSISDYALLSRIGKGAYGEVWLGRSLATGAYRAVKIVQRSRFGEDRPYVREFEGIRRYETVSHSHPSQLAVFHVGRDDQGRFFYYVMELADPLGESPRSPTPNGSPDNIHRESPGDSRSTHRRAVIDPARYRPRTLRSDLAQGPLEASVVLEYACRLAEALAHLHSRGLVHRDIKPSNIIFVDGALKLADIGLVSDVSDHSSVVGTEGYIAPEGPGTPTADVYALGKVLYEALTGLDRRRYPTLPEHVRLHPNPSQFFEINEIILKACASDSRGRYQEAGAMLADLQSIQRGKSVRRGRAFERLRRQVGLLGILVAAIAALVGLGMALEKKHRETQAAFTSTLVNPANPRRSEVSVAVLPFSNENPSPGDEHLGNSIAEEIGSALGRSSDLTVTAADSSLIAGRPENDRTTVTRQLGVRYLVQGRVRSQATNLSIFVELVTSTGPAVWFKSYSGTPQELTSFLREIPQHVAGALRTRFSNAVSRMPLEAGGTENVDAWRSFQLAHALLERREQEPMLQATKRFQHAVDLDPRFTRAWVGLADSIWFIPFNGLGKPDDHFPRAIQLLEHALTLDPSLGETHCSLAHIKANYQWDYEGAERSYQRGIELAPNYVRGRYWYGIFLAIMGRGEEGLRQVRFAQTLDPLSLGAHLHSIWVLQYMRRFDEAIAECHKALEVSPDASVVHGNLGLTLAYIGRWADARDPIVRWLGGLGENPIDIEAVGLAAQTGNREKFYRLLLGVFQRQAAKGRNWGFGIGAVHAMLGETDAAMRELEAAADLREPVIIEINVAPELDSLRGDPRFVALLKRMRLPPIRSPQPP